MFVVVRMTMTMVMIVLLTICFWQPFVLSQCLGHSETLSVELIDSAADNAVLVHCQLPALWVCYVQWVSSCVALSTSMCCRLLALQSVRMCIIATTCVYCNTYSIPVLSVVFTVVSLLTINIRGSCWLMTHSRNVSLL